MNIIIHLTESFESEKIYVCDYIFCQRLGFQVSYRYGNTSEYLLEMPGGLKLVVKDVYFDMLRGKVAYSQACLPEAPEYLSIEGVSDPLPVFYGSPELVQDEHSILRADIIGMFFFYLTGWEQVVDSERDSHGRFSALRSFAWRNNLLHRPVLDEWIDALRIIFLKQVPQIDNLPIVSADNQMRLSHDVDWPYLFYSKSMWASFERSARFMLRNHQSLFSIILSPLSWTLSQFGSSFRDPYDTFDLIMDVAECNGVKSTFYFLANTEATYNADDYCLTDSRIQEIVRHIDRRGHSIGLHGSYHAYNDACLLAQEFKLLLDVCDKLNIGSEPHSHRFHYLRWNTFMTPSILEQAGIGEDCTGGYADIPGFRFGTCHAFPLWSLKECRKINVTEQPLIAMERTLLDDNYMGFNNLEALEYILDLKKSCSTVHGCFSLLWHNSCLSTALDRDLFTKSVCMK